MDEFDASRSAARMRDAESALTGLQARFDTPGEDTYLDGNSLGLYGEDAAETLQRAVDQWRELGIEAWTEADPPWFDYGELLGDRLAGVLGAKPGECVAANSTTVNIHTLVGGFLDAADGTEVVVNELDFPTDHYAIRAQLEARGLDPAEHLVVADSEDGRTITPEAVADAVSDDTAVVFMPSVLYRSGQLLDVEAIVDIAHDHGAYAGFDLAHSVGVVDHDLHRAGVDFAVWCSYKYLNAGPGAVAGLFVHEDNDDDVDPHLAGWWGNEDATQFEMAQHFRPADGAAGWQIGTVNVFSAAPLFGALDVVEAAGIGELRDHSVALTWYLIGLVDERLPECSVGTPREAERRGGHVAVEHPEAGALSRALRDHSVALTWYLIGLVDERLPECSVGTPREAERRGGHVAVEHPEAGALSRALRDRGVVVDYRPPNVVRIAPSPYYVSHEDVWVAVDELRAILDADAHKAYRENEQTVT